MTAKSLYSFNRVEVSRSALRHNLDLLSDKSGLMQIPVLKSNAYGHGIEQVLKALDKSDVPYVGVNDLNELRRVQTVSDQPALVMNAIDPDGLKTLNCDNVAILSQDAKEIMHLSKICRKIKIHLDIDTGMSRYGIRPDELDDYLDLIESLKNVELEGAASHLADGDAIDTSYTDMQVELFDKSVAKILHRGIKPKYIHIANAPGFAKAKSKYANAMRPGIGFYGINPLDVKDPLHDVMGDVRPALRLVSTITKTRELKPGDSISYNHTFTAKKKMKIAVIPLGYYEGLPRSLSNSGHLKHKDKFLPIVGRICMNHTILDISGTDLAVGDEITVISDSKLDSNSIEQLSKDYYFFSYGLLVKLSPSIDHVLVD